MGECVGWTLAANIIAANYGQRCGRLDVQIDSRNRLGRRTPDQPWVLLAACAVAVIAADALACTLLVNGQLSSSMSCRACTYLLSNSGSTSLS